MAVQMGAAARAAGLEEDVAVKAAKAEEATVEATAVARGLAPEEAEEVALAATVAVPCWEGMAEASPAAG